MFRLYNTLDYPVYSLAAEKIKIAFRMVYSLLDKIAYFLNAYLQLGIAERRVTFKTIWYEPQKKDKGLPKEFQNRPNWPLRGLFWLAKDLYEDDPGLRNSIELLARDLADMRNYVEHKYLKLQEFGSIEPCRVVEPPADYVEPVAYYVSRSDFQASTLHILRLARSALIYLTLAIYQEEQRRSQDRPHEKTILEMPLELWDDKWKI